MTRLREALGELAEEAPPVSLADAAIARHRRRQSRRTVIAAVAAAVAVGTTAGAVAVWPRAEAPVVAVEGREGGPELPRGKGATIGHAYRPSCGHPCENAEWRVVTPTGDFRVGAADPDAPVAVSRDGRKLAYYSAEAGAHVVRDMVTGEEVTSPVKVAKKRIGIGSMLAVSDDGRHLMFDPKEGTKDPGLLIDVRTGRTRSIPGVYEVVGIKDGVASLVRYRKTDLWLTPVAGGGEPVRFDGTFIMFSELHPDGRTVAAVEYHKRRLTLLDARTGKILRTVPARMPDGGPIDATGIWLDRNRLVVIARTAAYAVDVRTGEVRRHTTYDVRPPGGTLVIPGLVQDLPAGVKLVRRNTAAP